MTVDVICLPDMDWDHVIWTNRQQVMHRLPRLVPGARVLYVAPPRFALARLLGRRRRLAARSFPEGQRPDGRWTTRIGERLWVLQPLLPVPNRVAVRLAPRLLDAWTLRLVRRAAERLGLEPPVLWTYTPLAAPFVGRLGERLVVYDVVDDYASLPEYAGSAVADLDDALTARADLVFVSSARVYPGRLALNPNALQVGNAADVELFASARAGELAEPADLLDVPRPRIAFHGAVSPWKLDLDLLESVARARPGWSLVLIGPVEDRETARRLGALNNVRLIGARLQSELPAYLAHVDACLIPYRWTPYTERIEPLKLYECLAAGRPVVATDLPCFLGREGVATAHDAEGIVRAVEAALADPPPVLSLEALESHGWDAKVLRLWSAIQAALGAEERAAA